MKTVTTLKIDQIWKDSKILRATKTATIRTVSIHSLCQEKYERRFASSKWCRDAEVVGVVENVAARSEGKELLNSERDVQSQVESMSLYTCLEWKVLSGH